MKNLTRKLLMVILTIACVVCMAVGLAACDKKSGQSNPTPLGKPVVTISATGELSWASIEHASGYEVYVANEDGSDKTKEDDVAQKTGTVTYQSKKTAEGVYKYTVVAVGDGTNYSSTESDVKTYTVTADQPVPLGKPVVTISATGELSWASIEHASGYEVYVADEDGSNKTKEDNVAQKTGTVTYQSKKTAEGKYSYTVVAVGDGTNYTSTESDPKLYTVAPSSAGGATTEGGLAVGMGYEVVVKNLPAEGAVEIPYDALNAPTQGETYTLILRSASDEYQDEEEKYYLSGDQSFGYVFASSAGDYDAIDVVEIEYNFNMFRYEAVVTVTAGKLIIVNLSVDEQNDPVAVPLFEVALAYYTPETSSGKLKPDNQSVAVTLDNEGTTFLELDSEGGFVVGNEYRLWLIDSEGDYYSKIESQSVKFLDVGDFDGTPFTYEVGMGWYVDFELKEDHLTDGIAIVNEDSSKMEVMFSIEDLTPGTEYVLELNDEPLAFDAESYVETAITLGESITSGFYKVTIAGAALTYEGSITVAYGDGFGDFDELYPEDLEPGESIVVCFYIKPSLTAIMITAVGESNLVGATIKIEVDPDGGLKPYNGVTTDIDSDSGVEIALAPSVEAGYYTIDIGGMAAMWNYGKTVKIYVGEDRTHPYEYVIGESENFLIRIGANDTSLYFLLVNGDTSPDAQTDVAYGVEVHIYKAKVLEKETALNLKEVDYFGVSVYLSADIVAHGGNFKLTITFTAGHTNATGKLLIYVGGSDTPVEVNVSGSTAEVELNLEVGVAYIKICAEMEEDEFDVSLYLEEGEPAPLELAYQETITVKNIDSVTGVTVLLSEDLTEEKYTLEIACFEYTQVKGKLLMTIGEGSPVEITLNANTVEITFIPAGAQSVLFKAESAEDTLTVDLYLDDYKEPTQPGGDDPVLPGDDGLKPGQDVDLTLKFASGVVNRPYVKFAPSFVGTVGQYVLVFTSETAMEQDTMLFYFIKEFVYDDDGVTLKDIKTDIISNITLSGTYYKVTVNIPAYALGFYFIANETNNVTLSLKRPEDVVDPVPDFEPKVDALDVTVGANSYSDATEVKLAASLSAGGTYNLTITGTNLGTAMSPVTVEVRIDNKKVGEVAFDGSSSYEVEIEIPVGGKVLTLYATGLNAQNFVVDLSIEEAVLGDDGFKPGEDATNVVVGCSAKEPATEVKLAPSVYTEGGKYKLTITSSDNAAMGASGGSATTVVVYIDGRKVNAGTLKFSGGITYEVEITIPAGGKVLTLVATANPDNFNVTLSLDKVELSPEKSVSGVTIDGSGATIDLAPSVYMEGGKYQLTISSSFFSKLNNVALNIYIGSSNSPIKATINGDDVVVTITIKAGDKTIKITQPDDDQLGGVTLSLEEVDEGLKPGQDVTGAVVGCDGKEPATEVKLSPSVYTEGGKYKLTITSSNNSNMGAGSSPAKATSVSIRIDGSEVKKVSFTGKATYEVEIVIPAGGKVLTLYATSNADNFTVNLSLEKVELSTEKDVTGVAVNGNVSDVVLAESVSTAGGKYNLTIYYTRAIGNSSFPDTVTIYVDGQPVGTVTFNGAQSYVVEIDIPIGAKVLQLKVTSSDPNSYQVNLSLEAIEEGLKVGQDATVELNGVVSKAEDADKIALAPSITKAGGKYEITITSTDEVFGQYDFAHETVDIYYYNGTDYVKLVTVSDLYNATTITQQIEIPVGATHLVIISQADHNVTVSLAAAA